MCSVPRAADPKGGLLPAPARFPALGLALFLAAVVLPLAFALPRLTRHHGDECYYTDAAIRMVQTGDYWTPRYPDGRERFVKPIVTYWATAASYHLLGISYFSSRLPFLLAGLGILFLTWRLASVLFGRGPEAGLAVLIAGSNFQLLTISTRSTPDALLSLWTLLSLLGFARIWFRGDTSWGARLMAWIGVGLAVQTKGLLGLCPLGFMLLLRLAFRGCAPPAGARWWDPWSVAAGLVAALFWYVVVWGRHGGAVGEQFFSDQVTAKTSFQPWTVLTTFGVYLVAVLRHFLPWTLVLLLGGVLARSGLGEFYRQRRREVWFLAGWFLLLAVVFSFGNMRRTRYLVAAYPLLSILLAQLLVRVAAAPAIAVWRTRLLYAMAAVAGVGALAFAWLGGRVDGRMFLGGAALGALGMGLAWAARRGNESGQWLGLALVPVVLFGIQDHAIRPVFSVVPSPAMAERLLEVGLAGGKAYAWKPGSSSYPSQIRVLTGGRVAIEETGLSPDEVASRGWQPLLLSQAQTNGWPELGFRLERCAEASPKRSSKAWRSALQGPAPRETLARARTGYFLAWRPQPSVVPAPIR